MTTAHEPLTPLNADLRPPEALRPGDWLSAHVYYAGERDTLLADCVAPLYDRLHADGLVTSSHFLRHWLEGAHLRLRLKPVDGAVPAVREAVENAVGDFLRARPSVYEPATDLTDAQYKQRFLLEFSEAQWDARYGPGTTRMARRANNSLAYLEYLPELGRYGGPAGVELAEWQAGRSSGAVLELMRSANVHVGSVRLGIAAQMMVTLAFALLGDVERTVAFLERRNADWQAMFQERYGEYDAAYARMAPSLRGRVDELHEGVLRGDRDRLAGFVRRWAEHGEELRGRTDALAEAGLLHFPAADGGSASPAGPERARNELLAGFTHMTCNRLGVTVGNEDYLAYVLRRALLEQLG